METKLNLNVGLVYRRKETNKNQSVDWVFLL